MNDTVRADATDRSTAEAGQDRHADDEYRVRDALERTLQDPGFLRAPQMSAFLRYVVERTLAGDSDRIKAYSIGVDALGKPATFDPQTDPSVRVLAKRLRDRLERYQATRPEADVRIVLRTGSYTPSFEANARAASPLPENAVDRSTPRAERDILVRPLAPGDGRRQSEIGVARSALLSPGQAPLGTRLDPATVTRAPLAGPSAAPQAPADERPRRPALYLVAAPREDVLARRIGFVLGGMLARIGGFEVRRVHVVPQTVSADDRVLALHASALEDELRVDLQLTDGVDGPIVQADVLTLHPAGDESLGRADFALLERWAGRYAAAATRPTQTAPRLRPGRWLASCPSAA